jgi:hypothetical protein
MPAGAPPVGCCACFRPIPTVRLRWPRGGRRRRATRWRCICSASILRATVPALVSATSASRANARAPASTAEIATGRTPALATPTPTKGGVAQLSNRPEGAVPADAAGRSHSTASNRPAPTRPAIAFLARPPRGGLSVWRQADRPDAARRGRIASALWGPRERGEL